MGSTAALKGELEVETERPVLGEPICLRLTLANESDHELKVISPDVGQPPAGLEWPASLWAYRLAVLMSYDLFTLSVQDAGGRFLEGEGLMPWVTPILPSLTLAPGESLSLAFDLAEFYTLDAAGTYRISVRYGPAQEDEEAGSTAGATAKTDLFVEPAGLD